MRSNYTKKILLAFLLLASLVSCKKPEPDVVVGTPYDLAIPRFFPTKLNLPEDNPLTNEGVELGRYLFYDTRLSGELDESKAICCASCHLQSASFDLGSANALVSNGRPVGLAGNSTQHTALPLVNLVFNNEGYTWNGAVSMENTDIHNQNIEDIVAHTIVDPTEMNSTWERSLNAIRTRSEYANMFRKAFGTEEITKERVCKAIAQFVRTLVSANSKFDRYLRGEENLTSSELSGYILFSTEEGADCFHCHGGAGSPLFTTNLFYNNALDSTFFVDGDRYSITGNVQDVGAYRAPTLRNIAVSAPYMHDGRFSSLDEVLQFYNLGLKNSQYVHPYMHKINEGGAMLTPSQIADLKAFLITLTDEEFIANEKISDPFKNINR